MRRFMVRPVEISKGGSGSSGSVKVGCVSFGSVKVR